MLKKLAFTVLALVVFTPFALAQNDDPPKNVIVLTASAEVKDVDFKNIPNEITGLDTSRVAPGFNFEYIRFLRDSPIGIGFSVGATFKSKPREGTFPCGPNCFTTLAGTSEVENAWWKYKMYAQKRKGTFQPFVHADIGGQNGQLGGVSAGPTGNFRLGPGHQFTWGGGGGFDLCFGEKKGKCFRAGVTATKAFNSDTRAIGLRADVGFAIKFGGQ